MSRFHCTAHKRVSLFSLSRRHAMKDVQTDRQTDRQTFSSLSLFLFPLSLWKDPSFWKAAGWCHVCKSRARRRVMKSPSCELRTRVPHVLRRTYRVSQHTLSLNCLINSTIKWARNQKGRLLFSFNCYSMGRLKVGYLFYWNTLYYVGISFLLPLFLPSLSLSCRWRDFK